MMHPATRLQWIDDRIGYGVFATARIPRGTIVFVQDALDVVLDADSPLLQDPAYRELLAKYSYLADDGSRILCWDIAKYVNHCCHANALSTGYGFEIAVEEIQAGEEITDDYGLLNLPDEMVLVRHHDDCRGVLRPSDFCRYRAYWDQRIQQALPDVLQVPQPLFDLLDAQTRADLLHYLTTGQGYRSVDLLRPAAASVK